MPHVFPLFLVLMVATGCGNSRGPSPQSSQDEYEEVHGRDFDEARRLHDAGRSEESASILRRLMADDAWQVRARAISVAGELHEQSLVPDINNTLKDSSLFVRERASRTLQTLGNASSLAPLREALSEPDGAVRGNIVEALARIGRAGEIPALLPILRNDADAGVRARTAFALGEIGDTRARPALEQSARSDPDEAVRATSSEALKKLP